MYDLFTTCRGEKWLVATFASFEEALAVRNGYLACGTDVVIVAR